MSLATKFVSFDRLRRYTQHVKSYVGQQILNAKGEWAKQLNLKVDKVEGKGLSTNDFTTELKNKLNGIEAGAQVNTVTGIKGNAESAYRIGNVNLTPANIGAVASSNGDASNTKVTFTQSTSRVNLTSGDTLKTAFGKLSKWFVDLKAVAFSGSYNDLSNKPTTLKNPKSLTIQQNGGNQTEYDGSTALTVNITKAGIGLGNVENKSSATIRSELTNENITGALGYIPVEFVNENFRRAEIRTFANSGGVFLSKITVDDDELPTYFQFKSPLYGFKVQDRFYIGYNDGSAEVEVTSVAWYDGTAFAGTSAPAVVFCKLDNSDASNLKLIILKVAEIYPDASLNVKVEGTEIGSYNGSEEKNVNITKSSLGLGNVENKSSATIRSELTSSNVTTALGYTPINSSATNLTNQNLDAYKGTDYMGKMYYAAGGNNVTGKPSGVDNFWMWVTRNGAGVFSQILMDNKCQLHTRCHTGSWSAWKQVISSGNNISLLNNDKGYQTLQQVEDKINSIISSEIGQITTFSFQVVEELPSSGTSNHIYLVPISGSTESDNYYEEYCYINSKWELIGTTKVDLTAYAKKTDIPTALKNPNAMTLQINGASQGTYDGSAAKTYNVSKESLGLGNVENKSSATIRGELTLTNVRNALGFDFDADQVISMCTHSKSGTVHTLVSKDGNTRYSLVRFVATADFTSGDTFRFGSASSPTVVTPKTEDGKLLTTGAFKKGSVVIAYTGDTTETVNTLFFKGGGGVDISGATATANDVVQEKTFFGKDGGATGAVPRYTKKAPKTAGSSSGGLTLFIDPGFYGYYGQSGKQDPYIEFDAGAANVNQVLDNATFTSNSGLLQQGTRVYLGTTPIFDCEYVETDNANSAIYLRPQNGSEYFAFDRNIQVSLRSLAYRGLPIIILRGNGLFQVDYMARQNFGYAPNPGEVNVEVSGISYMNSQYNASDLSYTVTLSITLTVSVGSYTSRQFVVLKNVKIKSFT